VAKPGDADAIADPDARAPHTDCVDHADHLVSGHNGRSARGELSDGEVQIRAAHAARGHPDPQLVVPGLRPRPVCSREWSVVDGLRLGDDPGPHTIGSG
jgi:hypothetical protein